MRYDFVYICIEERYEIVPETDIRCRHVDFFFTSSRRRLSVDVVLQSAVVALFRDMVRYETVFSKFIRGIFHAEISIVLSLSCVGCWAWFCCTPCSYMSVYYSFYFLYVVHASW